MIDRLQDDRNHFFDDRLGGNSAGNSAGHFRQIRSNLIRPFPMGDQMTLYQCQLRKRCPLTLLNPLLGYRMLHITWYHVNRIVLLVRGSRTVPIKGHQGLTKTIKWPFYGGMNHTLYKLWGLRQNEGFTKGGHRYEKEPVNKLYHYWIAVLSMTVLYLYSRMVDFKLKSHFLILALPTYKFYVWAKKQAPVFFTFTLEFAC